MKQELTVFLQKLNAINEALTYNVNLPSSNTEISFKFLNTEQFNRILGTVSVSDKTGESFNEIMVSVLEENLIDKTISVKDLSILDYTKIVLETRKTCLTDIFNLLFTESEIEEQQLSKAYASVSLSEHLQKHEDVVAVADINVVSGELKATVSMPSISVHTEFDSVVKSNKNESTSVTIKNFFIKEVAKYVTELHLDGIAVSLLDVPARERIEVINNLPATLVNEIVKNIELIKQPLTRLLSVTVISKNINNENVSFMKELPLNSVLFNF